MIVMFGTVMLKEDLIKSLKEFGMGEYEAKAYLALTIHGPLPASLVSEKSKIPQSKIYDTLKSLVSKSLAEFWNGRPLRYKAVEPVLALKKIIEHKRIDVDKLNIKTNSLLNELKPFKGDEFGLWSSKGKRAFLEKAAEMIGRSNKFGYATTSRFSRYSISDNAYSKALKKGIKIKIIGTSELDEARRARAIWYASQGAEIRILPMNVHPILGLVDDKEVCIRVDNSSEPDFIWSNNPALINISKTYFQELWERAKKFNLVISK